MVTAAAAPLVVASAYIPISLSSGAGKSIALTYAAATSILVIFTVGFAQMAKRITSAGAFYTFSTHGLGRPIGLGTGFTVLAAYSMISPAIAGGFGFYFSALLESYFSIDVAWYWCSIGALALMFFISYARVTVGAKLLAIALSLEVIVVLIVALATIGSGGTEGQQFSALSPTAWAAAPAIGIGFFLAFWSWIGFETTAIYGEETMDPKKAVPRATYIAVITLGVFYTIAAYAAVVGFGSNSEEQATTLLDQYFFVLADNYTFHFVRTMMDFLVVTGFFACSFAFHNNASRYFFSLGRDRIFPKALGRTHPRFKSPYIAAALQSVVAITTVILFAAGGADPLLHLGTWLPIFCTLSVLTVQMLVSLAVIRYFNRIGRKGWRDTWKTGIAPILGALAQLVVIVLLINNLAFIAGSSAWIVKAIPYFVAIIVASGILYALILRRIGSERYNAIGTLHDEETREVFVDELFVRGDGE